ncbi:MAG: hypothetical protein ACI4BA_08150 [Prevotella sp.]
MKFRSLFFSALCGLAVSAAFTSCSDDDPYDPYEYGSNVVLPEHRGLVLNEGSDGENNASISFFDAVKDTTTKATNDLYFIQNKKKLGDTAQDIIYYDGNIYVVVYGSNYIAKLNKAGFEEKRYSFATNHGQPRYVVEYERYLYVTTAGGYIVKLDANTLQPEADCIIGKTPERIVEKDGILYVAIGNTYDPVNPLIGDVIAIVDTRKFNDSEVKKVTVMENTQLVAKCGNYIMVQGYGSIDYTHTPLWVYDIKSGKAEDTGEYATYVIEVNNGKEAFVVFSETDWDTWLTKNTFYIYNPATKTKTDVTSKITSAVSELANASIYALSEGENGSFYIATTLYSSGNGTVYHFDSSYNLLGSFTSWGQNPKKVVVM